MNSGWCGDSQNGHDYNIRRTFVFEEKVNALLEKKHVSFGLFPNNHQINKYDNRLLITSLLQTARDSC